MSSCLWMVVCFECISEEGCLSSVPQNLWFAQELVAQNKEILHSQLLKTLNNFRGSWVQMVDTSAF